LALGAEIVAALYCRYMYTHTAPKYVPPGPAGTAGPPGDDCPANPDPDPAGATKKPYTPPQDPAFYQDGIAACGGLFTLTLAAFLFECWHAPIARAPTAPPVSATSGVHIGLEAMGHGPALHGPAPPRYLA